MREFLKTENLTRRFEDKDKTVFAAVDKVSFTLYEGETLGIVGESGCGKSTLVKLITGLRYADSGKILLDGQDITRARGKKLREVYRQMQMVFQSPVSSFDPRKTVGYGISESLRNNGVKKAERLKRTAELLEKCGLSAEYATRYPHEMSGGECQRAAIARALAIKPKILICDEATSALDVTVQQQIMELLQSLKREKKLSFLFICHNLALVQSFCDRVIVMQDGKIAEEGTPEEIINSPKSEYTKRLIDAAF